ncbi:MAG: hypothetical protein IVW55_04400 [Chloroflexi bacterium]|nr:hypothetical protein [Chloroflexota bacterium]
MVEQKVRVLSEGLARAVGRRKFLQQTGATIFGGVAALAAGHVLGGSASAAGGPSPSPNKIPSVPVCSPPGPYCNYEGGYPPQPDSCNGAHCFQHMYNGEILQCRVYYAYYQGGCWTATQGNGYWTCCDCACGDPVQATCGCAMYSGSPIPLPSNPGRG